MIRVEIRRKAKTAKSSPRMTQQEASTLIRRCLGHMERTAKRQAPRDFLKQKLGVKGHEMDYFARHITNVVPSRREPTKIKRLELEHWVSLLSHASSLGLCVVVARSFGRRGLVAVLRDAE